MKNYLLVLIITVLSVSLHAQKVIQNPDYISSNAGKIIKVELTDKVTVLHFAFKRSLGSWIYIPKETYIEDSYKGGRLYVTKSEGISLNKKITITDSNEIRYKLYFPALGKDAKKINYGESNVGGNWFISKLDLTKDGKKNLIKEGLGFFINENINFAGNQDPFNRYTASSSQGIVNNKTLLPEDLPKAFFGNWYDKYGTLMLVTTPEFIVSDIRVSFYKSIKQIDDNRYSITHSGGHIEIIKLDEDKMSLRRDKLQTFYKEPINNKVPKFLKGTWEFKNNKLTIADTSVIFDGENSPYIFGSKQLRIAHVAPSKKGGLYWFILYNEGNYYIYIANKINGEYLLSSRGWQQKRYKKIK